MMEGRREARAHDTGAVGSLKALDSGWPIREADTGRTVGREKGGLDCEPYTQIRGATLNYE